MLLLVLLAWAGVVLAQGGAPSGAPPPADVAEAIGTVVQWAMGLGGAGGVGATGASIWLRAKQKAQGEQLAELALKVTQLEAQVDDEPVPTPAPTPDIPEKLGERLVRVEEHTKTLRRDHDGLKQDLQRDLDSHRRDVAGTVDRIREDVRRYLDD